MHAELLNAKSLLYATGDKKNICLVPGMTMLMCTHYLHVSQNSKPSDLAQDITVVLLITLFLGPKAVFGRSTAANTWCSEAEVIMWVTSRLHLESEK